VCNVKRRIASLQPITRDAFETETRTKVPKVKVIDALASSNVSSDDEDEENEDEQSASPFQCLFCNQAFASDDAGFATNLEHMRTAHGMSIPDVEKVVDLQSFIGYLATEVRVWHECLYCGAMKPSTPSIQSHMRDKGHCLLNLEREPELLDFWESPRRVDGDDDALLEQEHPTNLSATELRFASGKVIESRHTAHASKKVPRKRGSAVLTSKALSSRPDSGSEDATSSQLAVRPQPASNRPLPIPKVRPERQLARREEMSITGISVQKRQALVLAEKKAQRSEAVARRAREWVYAKGSNSQKYDQLDNQAKWGKQQHKLLPR
jgi:pre-60S factor REI1